MKLNVLKCDVCSALIGLNLNQSTEGIRCPTCGLLSKHSLLNSPEPLQLPSKPKAKRIGFLAGFLWFFLIPNVLTIPALTFSCFSIVHMSAQGAPIGRLFKVFEMQVTIAALVWQVFLPVAAVAFCLAFLPWRSRVIALICGLLFVLLIDGAGAVYYLSNPISIDTRLPH